MHYDYMVHIKIRLFFKQNRMGVMELCAASLRFTAIISQRVKSGYGRLTYATFGDSIWRYFHL